jgi:ABC-type Zn2+ transport system substrate-binding protein/surface adhesin
MKKVIAFKARGKAHDFINEYKKRHKGINLTLKKGSTEIHIWVNPDKAEFLIPFLCDALCEEDEQTGKEKIIQNSQTKGEHP